MVAINCPACTLSPSSTLRAWILPGIRELTTTSLASTVPINCKSLECWVEKKYQQREMMKRIPINMKIRLRGFMGSFLRIGRGLLSASAFRQGLVWPAGRREHGQRTGQNPGIAARLFAVFRLQHG